MSGLTFDNNSGYTTGALCMWGLIALLKGQGWTQSASSDGSTTGASQVTGGASGAHGLANNSAWVVLTMPTLNSVVRSIAIQRGTTNTDWIINYSRSAGFTGGSATVLPTATDGICIWGTSTSSVATLFTTDNLYRWNAYAADSTNGYAFGMFFFNNGGGGNATTTCGALVLEFLSSGTTAATDTEPYVWFVVGSGSTGLRMASTSYSTTPGTANTNNANIWATGYLSTTYTAGNFVGFIPITPKDNSAALNEIATVPTNPYNSNDETWDMRWYRDSSKTSPVGRKGTGALVRIMGTSRVTGDTLSVANSTAKDFIYVGQFLFPWGGSTPTV